jgi:hypothetical protein
MYAFDAISEKGSSPNICKVLSTEDGKITNVLGFEGTVPGGVERSWTSVGSVHKEASDFGSARFRMFGRGLRRVGSRHTHRKLCQVAWEEFSRRGKRAPSSMFSGLLMLTASRSHRYRLKLRKGLLPGYKHSNIQISHTHDISYH